MSKKLPLVNWHKPPGRAATVLPLRGIYSPDDKVTDYDRRNMTLYT